MRITFDINVEPFCPDNQSGNKGYLFIIDHVALAKQGDDVLGSIRPSVCLCSKEQ